MSKTTKKSASKKASKKEQVKQFLLRTKRKSLSYAELAEVVDSGAMACGQILKSLAKEPGMKKLTSKVKSQKQLAA